MLIATPYYFISCYRYVMVMLLLCYTYRQQSMNKHSKNSVKANFQHLILNKTAFSSHLPKNQPLIDIERIVHSKHPKHSELDEETALLIEALEKHERYSLRKLQLEREKYLNHFKLMHRTLEDECSAYVRQLFACKRRNIKSKKEYLERRGQLCGEEKLLQLRKESIFEAIFFEVHLSDLSTFRADIQKYTMSPWEKAIASSLRTDQQTCKISSQDLPSPVLFKQQAAQTDSPSHQQSAEESEDDILCCQEQLGRKISNTSRRRRRYAVGRRDVIREEDESEASSLISESEGLC